MGKRKALTVVLGLLTAGVLSASAHAGQILIDVGLGNNTTTGQPLTWNNAATGQVAFTNLLDTTGAATGISTTSTNISNGGVNGTGTTNPTTPLYPTSAASDFYALSAGTTGTVTFNGLDANTTYTFTILASRAVARNGAGDRTGNYSITGNAPVVIEASAPSGTGGNTTGVVIATNAVPVAGSLTLTIDVPATNGATTNLFGYLNVIQIDTATAMVPEPAMLGLISLAAPAMLARRRKA